MTCRGTGDLRLKCGSGELLAKNPKSFGRVLLMAQGRAPVSKLAVSRDRRCDIAVFAVNPTFIYSVVIELSRLVFEVLRKDEEFVLYRGRSKNDSLRVIHMALETVK
jgi:hypothetical protein